VNAGTVAAAHEASPPRSAHDGPGDVARCDRDVGALVDRADELIDDLDGDREVGIEEDDGISRRAADARADRGPFAAMLQRQVPVRDPALGQGRDRVGERLSGVIGRAVVGDDDLGSRSALVEVLRACREARRDAASLVIGREN
jgi:hypothetical protein